MSLSAKIDLENNIFARAAKLHTAVNTLCGGLVSPSEDLELQTLLYVYNVNFRAQNYQQFCEPDEALEARRYYRSQYPRCVGLTRIYSVRELNYELVLSEGK